MKLRPVLMCVQPSIPYFAWQIEVMLTNFKSLGLHNDFDIHLLFAYNTTLPTWENDISWAKAVEENWSDVANFYYYDDKDRNGFSYISSVRPHTLKQHFKAHPHLSTRPIFYHDCDIIFTKYPDFIFNLLEDDNNWYVSDTKSYIGYSYIASKGDDVVDKMCHLVGVHPEFIKEREEQSGGAQYLMKGVDWVFFDKMEKDCESLFKNITALNNEKIKADPTHHPLQIWTADMWAILWNAWLRGYKTNIIPEMDFCWATDPIEKYQEKYIFHNAGVVEGMKETIFFKGEFRNTIPYNIDIQKYDSTKASYKYVELLKSVTGSNLPAKEVYETIYKTFPPEAKLTSEMKSNAEKRLRVCVTCEHLAKDLNGNYLCRKCGCSTKVKVFMGTQNDCPEQKWKI